MHIPLLIDDGSTCTVATKAFFASKLPYKLILESAFKKRKQLYIGPDKEIGSYTIWRYLDDLVVGRATYTNGLYVVQLALKPYYIAYATVQQLDINILH